MSYVQRVLADLKKRNPGENEFHQAATEILLTLEPVINAHPEYEKNALLERFTEPERTILFRVPWDRIDVSKHVEREYVSDDSIIIYIHKEINSIETKEDKINTINVLTDRFGKLSTTVLDYVEERYLEALLRKMDVKKIKDEETYVEFTIPREYSSKLKGDVVLMAAYKISDAFNFNYRNYEFEIILNKKSKDKAWLYIMTQFLEKIII